MSTDDGTAGAPTGAPAAPGVSAGPLVEVVRGEPDAYEVAALLGVLTARAGQATDATQATRATATDTRAEGSARPGSWAAYWRGVRQPTRPGPDGWRDSARPR